MRTQPIAYATKIATCCHCGTKAALLLDQTHHALACSSCGAPLRDLKQVPTPVRRKPAVTHQPKPQGFAKISPVEKSKPPKRSKPARRKKRKGWFGKKFKDMAEDIFDVVEDIFD